MTKLNTAFSKDLITLAVEVIVGTSFGSGIYVGKDNQVFFCTARHVLYNNTNPNGPANYQLIQNTIELKSYPKNSNFAAFEKLQINLQTLGAANLISFSQTIDLCVFKIAHVQGNQLNLIPGVTKMGANLNLNVAASTMVKPANQIEVGEELYVIGYPKALQFLNTNQPFYDYNLPLVRKGITSCMNNYQTFVIDCAVFGGNSGGPVFIADNTISFTNGTIQIKNNRYLVGIAVQYVPLLNMTARQMNPPAIQTFNHAENSGYAICVSFELITNEIENIIQQNIT